MYIRNHDNPLVTADVCPHATGPDAPDVATLFLSAAPCFTVSPNGIVWYAGKPVTLTEEARRCGEYLLALIEAERIAGKDGDNSVIAFLAKSLVEVTP